MLLRPESMSQVSAMSLPFSFLLPFEVGDAKDIATSCPLFLVHDQAALSGMVRCDSWEQSK